MCRPAGSATLEYAGCPTTPAARFPTQTVVGVVLGDRMSSFSTAERHGRRHRRGWGGGPDQAVPTAQEARPPPAVGAADAVLESLYTRYWADLVSYVNGMLSDRHQAEEIVQETMLGAWRHAEKLTPERGSVWGWLCRVAHNIMVDRLRRERARPTETEKTAGSDTRVVADHSLEVTNSVYVLRALGWLQPGHRTVLYLVYYQDRTCSEAAAILGVPIGTVKSRLHYAMRQLRTILAEDGSASD
jgi:RNA polymerase sigma-70 factor, ECF subfamily